ncbi:VNG_1110C family protein [Halogranum rubrum]|uniref:Uncharacterized protein n=1 Tax=Halogranum salarium B-1 TaxID=1210908 RepID=J3JGW0_9EURY|nr:hypothetical protein [Halogranum salarium]EJN60441.1 hypothetical protein HSB1_10440 [Halogranum salarium B-1]
MSDPSQLRDSTEIVLPCATLGELRDDIESQFTVSVVARTEACCRIIGSPVEIKAVSDYLARHGVSLP